MKNNNKEKLKSVKIEVTEEEHQRLLNESNQMKYSIRKYVKMKALDNSIGVEQRCRQIMQIMPKFYNHVNDIEDSYTRQKLMEIGGQICQHLK